MKQIIVVGLIVLNGCGSTTVAVPAGFADGTKDVFAEGLIFTSVSKSVHLNSGGTIDLQDYQVSYRNTSDRDIIVAIVNGQEITLNFSGGKYQGSNSTYTVFVDSIDVSSDAQVELGNFRVTDGSTGESFSGYVASGLPSNPAAIGALAGSATYTGTVALEVLHDTGTSLFLGKGAGTATISANFSSGIVFGAMAITDNGASDFGYGLLPTNIQIDPTLISGNGFSTTLTIATPSDLAMNSVSSSALDGTFFGLNAADVGGTFSAQGVSIDGTSPAFITGGFIGQ